MHVHYQQLRIMAYFNQVNYKRVYRHLLFWCAYIIYQAFNEGWQDKDVLTFQLSPAFLTDVPVSVFVCYVNFYLLMPAFYNSRRYVSYITGLLLLLLTGALLQRFFSYLFWVPYEKITDPAMYITENKNFWIPVRLLSNSAQIFPVVAVTMLIKLMLTSYNNEKKLRAIEQEKFAAEMRLLRAQINPHFFFNTLNSLYSLTLAGSQKASDVVLRLSNLMHYMLYEANAEKVLLKHELKQLEDYISIEQMRFAERLELSFTWSGDIDGKLIAPLLLLPFIENAFKHSIENSSGWITINLNVINNRLFLKVDNSCAKDLKTKDKGIGLNNVKRRLELIYPKQYELSINDTTEIFSVDLKLNL